MQEMWDILGTIGFWCLVALVAIIALRIVWVIVRTINEGKKMEAALNARFLDVQNHLADSLFRIRSIGSVTNCEANFIESMMHEAISGRYGNEQGISTFILAENYPDGIVPSAPFERIAQVINGSMADYRRYQSSLLSQLEKFETWRTGTLLSRIIIGNRYPDNDLVARIGGQVFYGPTALEQMYRIVHTEESLQAYNTAVMIPYNHNFVLDDGLD
jgi:hypothetical protein